MPLSDFDGAGSFWIGAAVVPILLAVLRVILLVVAHLLWPRGTDLGLRCASSGCRAMRRCATLRDRRRLATVAMAATGVYAYHNTNMLNRYETARRCARNQRRLREEISEVREAAAARSSPRSTLDVAALSAGAPAGHQRALRASQRDQRADHASVHVRQGDRDSNGSKLDVAGARLRLRRQGLRLPHLPVRQAAGAGRDAASSFASRLWQRGFRAQRQRHDVIENGTFVNNIDFAPIIGMDRQGLLSDRAKRRSYGLPPELRPAKLEESRDRAATTSACRLGRRPTSP